MFPLAVAAPVDDILILPLSETPYTTIKGALRRLVPMAHHRLEQLLSNAEHGNKHPTKFLRHLQPPLSDTADSLGMAVLRELFLQCLPANVGLPFISAHKSSLSELAELPDDIIDVAPAAINTARRSPVSEVDSLWEIVQSRASSSRITPRTSRHPPLSPPIPSTT